MREKRIKSELQWLGNSISGIVCSADSFIHASMHSEKRSKLLCVFVCVCLLPSAAGMICATDQPNSTQAKGIKEHYKTKYALASWMHSHLSFRFVTFVFIALYISNVFHSLTFFLLAAVLFNINVRNKLVCRARGKYSICELYFLSCLSLYRLLLLLLLFSMLLP